MTKVTRAPWAVPTVVMVLIAAVTLGFLGWYAAQWLGREEGHPAHQESPAIQHPEVAGLRVVTREVMTPPVPAYDFRLIGPPGSTVRLSNLEGKTVLMSFIYTNCPEACPLLTGHYLTLQQEFSEPIDQGNLVLLFITTDPERDTPEWLQEYTRGRGGKWRFLSGNMAEMKKTWSQYGIYREVRQGLQDVVVYHSYKSYLIDGQGRIRYRYEGVWQPEDVVQDIHLLLEH